MFYEEDYIMRMIKEYIQVLLKLIFNIDTIESTSSFFESEETQAQYNELIRLVDERKINEAENKLYEMLETDKQENLKLSLLFYDYLNSLDDDHLQKADFSRAEIELGIKTVARMYGYDNFLDTLFIPHT